MKSLFVLGGLLLGAFAMGCAAEASDESVDETTGEVKAGVSHVSPGDFKLYGEPFHKVNPGCDVHTHLELKQTAAGAVAVLDERVGGMCLIAVPPNHREYKLRQTGSACNKVYEGETTVKNGIGFDPHGVSKIKIEDARGTTCMSFAFLGEIVVNETLAKINGPETVQRFSADASATVEAALGGNWGADQATMTFRQGEGNIELGCGSASLEDVTFTSATSFTATGKEFPGLPIQPLPGHEPQAATATFKGEIVGNKLTLKMTVNGETTRFVFTKNREVHLIHCA